MTGRQFAFVDTATEIVVSTSCIRPCIAADHYIRHRARRGAHIRRTAGASGLRILATRRRRAVAPLIAAARGSCGGKMLDRLASR